ncbi:unnamed protein product [Nezara viridula]|uniref:BTB domain-containing protein n=1 Tax=Nezara viridula TaxID=85310 RepID=A0A9P0HFN4_NEZVI|nr:unnamed protein product [Nezara viridula]
MDLKKWNIFSLLENDFNLEVKLACVFGNQGNEALLVMKNDDVYALGVNLSGCLGLGTNNGTLHPQKVQALCKKGVIGFAYGSGPHVICYTSLGEVYAWGHNAYCELANGTTTQSSNPMKVEVCLSTKVVVEVACGSHHSVVLTNEGEVYGWGYNGNGQLGNGNNVNQLNPCRVMALSNIVIVKVVCGCSHTLALSDEGKVYAWGANSFGQLACLNRTNFFSPEQILEDIGRIVDIAASHYCNISAAMSQNSKVYMWGQCRGQIVLQPILTPYNSLHEVFACYSTPSITYKPLTVAWDHGTKVYDSIKSSFDDQSTSDLIIRVEGKDIYVHKALLKIRCQHFRSMFQYNWQEDSRNVLEIEQFSYTVYRAFLRYLYTDQVDLPPEQALGKY